MAKWSVRKRSGSRTPSIEELLWYHFTPGGIYRTATASEGLQSEEFDYYVLSGLTWFGVMAYAADAAAAAQAVGTVNIAAELTLARPLTFLRASPYFAWGSAVVGAGVYMAWEPELTSLDRIEILGGAPGVDDSTQEMLVKLSF